MNQGGHFEIESLRISLGEHCLYRNGERIVLTAKPFDMLVALLQRAPAFVSWEDLKTAVWGKGFEVSSNNLATHLGAVRDALGETADAPSLVEVIRGVGVRLVKTPVFVATDGQARRTGSDEPIAPFACECHRFVPTFVGARPAVRRENGQPRRTAWGDYVEYDFPEGRLCHFESGVGVWHRIDSHEFDSIVALADWRAQEYRAVDLARHAICSQSVGIASENRGGDLFSESLGETPYTLLFVSVQQHAWSSPERLRAALRLLSSPKTLEVDRSERSRRYSVDLEREYLARDFEHPDIQSFSLGAKVGFACWSGVSLYDPTTTLGPDVVEFEIHLQAAWLLSHLVRKAITQKTRQPRALKPTMDFLRRQADRLSAVGPQDHTQQRLMVEAVLNTSRLRKQVQEVGELLQQLTGSDK